MSERDKAIVCACLEQIELVLEEAREVRTWWSTLSEDNRQEWKDFAASVSCYKLALRQ